jgi:hypothetical protein
MTKEEIMKQNNYNVLAGFRSIQDQVTSAQARDNNRTLNDIKEWRNTTLE